MPPASGRPRRSSPARSGPWLAVRAPAVYGPGDRETLAYFKWRRRGLRPQPDRAGRPAVPDPRRRTWPRRWRSPLERPLAASVYEIDDGRAGGYGYARHGEPPPRRRSGRTARIACAIPAVALMAAVARTEQASATRWAAPAQILTPGKVSEMFHQRLDGPRPAAGRSDRLRRRVTTWSADFADTVLWYRRARDGSRVGETLRNNLLFHKESRFLPHKACLSPRDRRAAFAHCP